MDHRVIEDINEIHSDVYNVNFWTNTIHAPTIATALQKLDNAIILPELKSMLQQVRDDLTTKDSFVLMNFPPRTNLTIFMESVNCQLASIQFHLIYKSPSVEKGPNFIQLDINIS